MMTDQESRSTTAQEGPFPTEVGIDPIRIMNEGASPEAEGYTLPNMENGPASEAQGCTLPAFGEHVAADSDSYTMSALEERAPSKASSYALPIQKERTSPRSLPRRSVSVYFVAGIGTWKSGNTFGPAMELLEERFRQDGLAEIHTGAMYPYGIMDHLPRRMVRLTMFRQALQVLWDMYRRPERSPAILQLTREIRKDYGRFGSGDIVLIGHSGGGIAAYGAARLLSEQGYSVPQVVQVGSPECHIQKEWRERVYRLRQPGWKDWATWWRFSLFGSPLRRDTVNIERGHPYYFCNGTKDQMGVSNLTKVIDKIWKSLQYITNQSKGDELTTN